MILAALISRAGVCAELLEDVLTYHDLISSEYIVKEVIIKLREKFQYPESEVREIRRFLTTTAKFVVPAKLPDSICRDPNDLPVLGTASAGQARLLISIDKDLLSIEHYEGVLIIKPGQFWRHARA